MHLKAVKNVIFSIEKWGWQVSQRGQLKPPTGPGQSAFQSRFCDQQ